MPEEELRDKGFGIRENPQSFFSRCLTFLHMDVNIAFNALVSSVRRWLLCDGK
jgi:hypothetical protein